MRLRHLLPCAVGSIPPFGICIRSAESPNWDRRGIDGPKYFFREMSGLEVSIYAYGLYSRYFVVKNIVYSTIVL